MRPRLLVLTAMLGASASGIPKAVSAQGPLMPGATVRVWSTELSRRPQAALLGAWRPDSLELHALPRRNRSASVLAAKPSWLITRTSVLRLDVEVSRTRADGALLVGLVGAGTGALTGVMLGAMVASLGAEHYPNGTGKPGVSPIRAGVPIGAVAGAMIGGIAGALSPGKRWRTTPVAQLGGASPAAPSGVR